MSLSIVKKILIVFFVMQCCSSCDSGFRYDGFAKKNFVWYHEPTCVFDRHVESYFKHESNHIYAITCWYGKERMAGLSNFVVLSCTENSDGFYVLDYGVVVDYLKQPPVSDGRFIRGIGVLKPENFQPFIIDEHKAQIRLLYSGDLYDCAHVNENSKIIRDWLKFDVKSRKDSEKVMDCINELASFLETIPELSDMELLLEGMRQE